MDLSDSAKLERWLTTQTDDAHPDAAQVVSPTTCRVIDNVIDGGSPTHRADRVLTLKREYAADMEAAHGSRATPTSTARRDLGRHLAQRGAIPPASYPDHAYYPSTGVVLMLGFIIICYYYVQV